MLRNKQNSLKNWRRLKKILNEEIDYLLFEDESMIRDYQALQKTWFAKGNQRIIQTYGKHEGVKLVGFLNYETGEVYVEEHKTYNAEVFKIFLQNVLKKYPQGKIVMILDNAKIHHAKLLKEFLEKNPRLQLEFLPPYSPNLNIIEELWLWLKNTVIPSPSRVLNRRTEPRPFHSPPVRYSQLSRFCLHFPPNSRAGFSHIAEITACLLVFSISSRVLYRFGVFLPYILPNFPATFRQLRGQFLRPGPLFPEFVNTPERFYFRVLCSVEIAAQPIHVNPVFGVRYPTTPGAFSKFKSSHFVKDSFLLFPDSLGIVIFISVM